MGVNGMAKSTLEMEPFGDRIKATLTGKGAVYFQIVQENLGGLEPLETIKMLDGSGQQLAKLTYVTHQDKTAEIQAFSVEGWDPAKAYAQRLLKWYIGQMRAKSITVVRCEIYKTDDKTHEKLESFKDFGFRATDMGGLGGTVQYALELRL